MVTLLGYLAAILSTASFAPQAWKIIRTRKTKDISALMYGLTVTGFACWFAFGLLKSEWPIVAANGICFLLSAFILVMKLLPQSGKEQIAKKVAR